jgi:hypothetical protein
MLGHQLGFVTSNQIAKAYEMGSVQRMRAADRHTHAVNRDRVVLADSR